MTTDVQLSAACLNVETCDIDEGRLTVRAFANRQELRQLAEVWNRWSQHPNADFASYLWMCEQMPDSSPLVLVVYRGEKPEAMLIGRVDDGGVTAKLGYKTVMKCQAKRLVVLYGGLIGRTSSEACEALAEAVWQLLQMRAFDVVFFNRVPRESGLHWLLFKRTRRVSRDLFICTDSHRSMALPACRQDLYSSCSSKVRKNLRYQTRQLEKAFPDRGVRCFRGVHDLSELCRETESIAAKTYQRGLGVGFSDTESLRNRLTFEASQDWLRGYILYIERKPIAFWLGKVYRGIWFSDFMGYDPSYAKYSPGMYLIMQVVESTYDEEEQISAIDFGLGDAQYKSVLGNCEWQEVSFYVFASTIRGVALNLMRSPIESVDRLAKKILNRATLLQKAKKVWRDRSLSD